MMCFDGRKILVVVPHQDDEINIAGGLLYTLSKNKNDIHILYTTNGDYCFSAEKRIRECVKSCKILGISEKNIHYLGYGDQYSKEDSHLFNTASIWTSKKGFCRTYGPIGKDEECYRLTGEHHLYNRQNFILDIEAVIEQLRPEVIFAIDFDSHCDHRSTSLAVEKALGNILKTNRSYRPLVYKSFAYPTAYYGVDDYNNINTPSTKFVVEKHSFSDSENPYYKYGERIRFPLDANIVKRTIWRNPVFLALKAYKTQVIIKHAFSIINGDQVFWQRNTDNLLFNSEVSVSSGDKMKLSDFMLFDCQDVLKGNMRRPILDDCAWEPIDSEPKIKINFDSEKQIGVIKIYNSVNSKKKISLKLYLDDELYDCYRFDGEAICCIDNICKKCSKVNLVFETEKVGDVSISELEIIEENMQDIKYIVAVDKNDDFIYKNIIDGGFGLKIYAYDSRKTIYLNPDDCNYYINGQKALFKDITYKKLPNKAEVKIELKANREISYEFVLKKNNIMRKISSFLICLANRGYLGIMVFCQRINRKIFSAKWRH